LIGRDGQEMARAPYGEREETILLREV